MASWVSQSLFSHQLEVYDPPVADGANKVNGIYAHQGMIDARAGFQEGPSTLEELSLQLDLPEIQKGPQLVAFVNTSTFQGLLLKPGEKRIPRGQKGPCAVYTTAYYCLLVYGTKAFQARGSTFQCRDENIP